MRRWVAGWVMLLAVAGGAAAAERPNIVWLSAEDLSATFGCYGDPHAITPAVDRLAEEGVRYTHAFTTAGVCAPCRSGIITGMYQSTIGTHHMRSSAQLPEQIKPFPTYLRQAGYYCTNNSKTDYQFTAPPGTWDESSGRAHWRNRPRDDQPFFAVFNFTGCHESGIASKSKYEQVTSALNDSERQDRAGLTTLPPYYPDTSVTREDWKRNYELITALDHWVADQIAALKEADLYENTIIFFWTDHGVGLPRAKRWLYESGTHIPLVVRIPERYRVDGQGTPGTVADRLVSSIDFGPTVLNLAGAPLPDYLQGRPFLGAHLPAPRDYVYGARDRMDERYDIIRMVRDKRYRYIRNYEPLKTYYQFMNTAEKGATMQEIRRLAAASELPPAAAQYMAPTKPVEELYDVANDPHELNNLVNDPAHLATLERLRAAHLQWVSDTRDVGLIPEPIIMLREAQLGSRYAILRQAGGGDYNTRLRNIAVLASSGLEALPQLVAALGDADDAIRYWGATGIGNMGAAAATANSAIEPLLSDRSATVRVAAARAAAQLGKPELALPVLVASLESDEEWVRLQAAIVLDEMGEAARPAIPALHGALKDQPNKYIVRVANRALNQLEGTDRQVP